MIRLVYIASPSYSGSTLLTFLLNLHPAVGTIGELKWGVIDLETYRCSCGALLRQCSFWQAVAAGMRARGLPFDLERPATDFRCRGRRLADRVVRARVRGRLLEAVRDRLVSSLPICRRTWPLIAAVNRGLIEIVLELQGARVFVDSSKDPVRLKHLLGTGQYDVRVIQLIRDGRGVTNSAIRNEGLSARRGALEWLRTHRQIERLIDRLSRARLLRVRYEDLCTELDAALAQIFDFADLEAPRAGCTYRSVEHHILGNRMRLRPGSRIDLDEKWRSMLSASDLAMFDRLAGTLNRRYGYK